MSIINKLAIGLILTIIPLATAAGSIIVPENASLDSYGGVWSCNSGYTKFDDACRRAPTQRHLARAT
jgi:hypothetical protein